MGRKRGGGMKIAPCLSTRESIKFTPQKVRKVNALAIKTVLREGETLDEGLRRFKRSVNKSGVLIETRKHEFYLKTSLRRKMKSELARRKKW